MSSFPGMRKLRITANDTKSLATKYSQAHFIYGNTEWFTAYFLSLNLFSQLVIFLLALLHDGSAISEVFFLEHIINIRDLGIVEA